MEIWTSTSTLRPLHETAIQSPVSAVYQGVHLGTLHQPICVLKKKKYQGYAYNNPFYEEKVFVTAKFREIETLKDPVVN